MTTDSEKLCSTCVAYPFPGTAHELLVVSSPRWGGYSGRDWHRPPVSTVLITSGENHILNGKRASKSIAKMSTFYCYGCVSWTESVQCCRDKGPWASPTAGGKTESGAITLGTEAIIPSATRRG